MSGDVVVQFPKMPSGQTRLNININAQTAHDIMDVAGRHKVSITEVVRRLIPIGAFIWRATLDGYEVQIIKGGKRETVRFNIGGDDK